MFAMFTKNRNVEGYFPQNSHSGVTVKHRLAGSARFPRDLPTVRQEPVDRYQESEQVGIIPDYDGATTRGIPTCFAANLLKKSIYPGDGPPPVWPLAEGSVRG